jgi:hypothetical protein
LVFEENANFFAENSEKLLKIALITSTPSSGCVTFKMRSGGRSLPLAVVARITEACAPFMPACLRCAVPWPDLLSLMDVEDRWSDNSSMHPICMEIISEMKNIFLIASFVTLKC